MTFPRPAKILHVFPSFRIGGVPLRTAGLIKAWAEEPACGLHHKILALDGALGAAGHLDGCASASCSAFEAASGGLFRRLKAIGRRLEGEAPDLLITYNWGAIEWAAANRLGSRRPHVHFEDGFGVEEARRQLRRRVWFRRFALSHCDRVVVPSKTLERIAKDLWRLDAKQIAFVPNGVDVAAFDPNTNDSKTVSPAGGVERGVVGTLAPLRPEKDLGFLIDACAVMNAPAKLRIAGDGGERHRLERQTQALGLEDVVSFLGHKDDVIGFLRSIDIFALTSLTEQMPISVLQAMAAGKAIAALDVGDVKDMVADVNRPFILAAGTRDGFAALLDRLIGDPVLCEALGRANRKKVEDAYGVETMRRAYGEIFGEALGRGEAPR